jgi:hypothetical protein
MGKRFKGEACAYCATPGISTTGDHVFARQFFPPTKKANLPQVPACEGCNRAKSKLEHYLTAVMPFGGAHADAAYVLGEMTEPRLARNAKLHQALAAGQGRTVLQEQGRLVSAMTIPFDSERLAELFAYIARGLALHHFGTLVPADYNVRAGMVRADGEGFFESLLSLNGDRISANLGEGAFAYEGVHSRSDPGLTVWKFQAYGGLRMTGDPSAPDEAPANIWATSSKAPALLDAAFPNA